MLALCGGIALLPLVDLLMLLRSESACPGGVLVELRRVLQILHRARSCFPGHVAVVRRSVLAGYCDLAHQLGRALRRPDEVGTEGCASGYDNTGNVVGALLRHGDDGTDLSNCRQFVWRVRLGSPGRAAKWPNA